MDAFEAYFEALRGKKIAVLGLGVSNRPLARLLLEFGCDVTGCDKTPREKLDAEVLALERAGCKLCLGEHYLDDVSADVVFRTPGMHPGNPAICRLRERGARITSEMDVFFRVAPCHLIGVTGSDGKTTTTTLISQMLKAAGKRVWLGGNIGTPLLPLCRRMEPEDYAVVELSSFQLMDMTHSPQRAVVTNLAPNHLDVHRNMEEYVEAKKNIFRFQDPSDLLVLNADNAITAAFRGAGQTHFFSRQAPTNCVWQEGDWIYRRGERVLNVHEILLPGVHNIENYMAAMAAVDGLADDEAIRRVAKNFGGVEHRIELVRELDGVRYYNDSIASSPSRTIAGLHSFDRQVILIAGGYDKHVPFDVLGPEVCAHVKLLILCGATADKIRAAVESAPEYAPGAPEIVTVQTLDAAVSLAHRRAAAGDIVTLSPACAAFDQFKNFMVRGETYKKMVMAL